MTSTRTKSLVAAGFALGFAMPAAAQTGLCGGVGENGQWIGGDEASSDIASSPDYLEQMALVLLRNEYVALFTVSSPTEVRVEAEGRGGGDPVIDLRNADGTIILSDDDSGGGGSSRGEMMLDAGSYCLSMTSYDGSPMTGFVRVSRTDQEALTVGTGMVTQDPVITTQDPFTGVSGAGCSNIQNFLGDGMPIDAMIAGGDGVSATASVNEVDAWGFTLSATTQLSITAENPAADPVITLYDQFGNYLAENDDWDGLNSRLEMIGGLQPGDYCIEMRALSDNNEPITVSVIGYDASAALIQSYNSGDASPPLDGSHPVTDLGVLGNRVRQDVQTTGDVTWFSFEIDFPGLVVIETVSNNTGDSVLFMYDDFGRELAYNDDANGLLDSQIIQRVNPGVYLVGVRQLGRSSSAPLRLLFERFVPAQ